MGWISRLEVMLRTGAYKSRDAKFDIVCCSIMADDEFKVCALELSDFVHNVLHIVPWWIV